MKHKERVNWDLTEKEISILQNYTITNDAACVMLNLPRRDVLKLRQYYRYTEARKEASQRFREKNKSDNRKYNFWKPDEIAYILTSEDTDEEQAKKLKRSVYAIQKKRERERERSQDELN